MAGRKVTMRCATEAIVCSPHPVTAAGFRFVLAQAGGFSAATFPLNADLGRLLAARRSALAIIDASEGVSIAFLAGLRAAAPETRIILWWMEAQAPEFIRQAMDCGVRGVIEKTAPIEACVRCVRQVAAGEVWLDDELGRRLLQSQPVRLTPREGQLVGLLTEGLRNKEIAWRMDITEGTTKAYLTRLYQKTGASDRFELAMFAIRNLGVGPGQAVARAEEPATSIGDGPSQRKPVSVIPVSRGAEFFPTTLASAQWMRKPA